MTTTADRASRGCRQSRGRARSRRDGPWLSASCRPRRARPKYWETSLPDLGEPIGAPVHQLADIAERDRLPFAVDDARLLGNIVPAALLLAGLLGDVADIPQLF